MQTTAPRLRHLSKAAVRQPRTPPAWLLPFSAVWLAFWPALTGDFLAWDDTTYLNDSAIQGTTVFWERLTSIFSSFYFSNYNPLHRVSNWVQLTLFDRDPRIMHMLSVLGHALNSTLVFLLLRRLNFRREVCLITSLLFAIHPCRVEIVAWFSAQKDIGSVFFTLLAFYVYAPILTGSSPKPQARLLAVAALFVAGLLFKSQVVVFPVLLLVLDLAWRRPWEKAVVEKLFMLVISATFAAITVNAAPKDGPISGEWSTHFATVVQAPWHYLYQLLWPFEYSARHWVPRPESIWSWEVVASVVGLVVLFAGAWRVLRRFDRRYTWLCLAWPLVCMLPVSNLVPIPIVVAERYLYLALLGPFIVLAESLNSWRRTVSIPGIHNGVPARVVAASVILAVLYMATLERTRAFRDTETLWRTSLAAEPENPAVRMFLAREILDSGDKQRALEAVALLEGSRELDLPNLQSAELERAKAYRILGNPGKAKAALDGALVLADRGKLRSGTAIALAKQLSSRNEFDEAHRVLQKVETVAGSQRGPLVSAHVRTCLDAGDDEGFLYWNAKQLELSPFNLILWNNREHVARRLGREDEAQRCAARFVELLGDVEQDAEP